MNKLSMKHQSHPESIKVDAFEQKNKCNATAPAMSSTGWVGGS